MPDFPRRSQRLFAERLPNFRAGGCHLRAKSRCSPDYVVHNITRIMLARQLCDVQRCWPPSRAFVAAERHISWLELCQESQQVWVVAPTLLLSLGFTHLECLRFHFQIYFRVNIGSFYGHVPKPGADRVDVDARAKQMRGSRVADGVRPDALFSQLRAFRNEFANVPCDYVMNAESS